MPKPTDFGFFQQAETDKTVPESKILEELSVLLADIEQLGLSMNKAKTPYLELLKSKNDETAKENFSLITGNISDTTKKIQALESNLEHSEFSRESHSHSF